MDWIYLSPHLDDVALSTGGFIWEQARRGASVQIWTLFAGHPPPGPLSPFAESLHSRWGTGREAMEQRRKEDIIACQRLGADHRHFPFPDCIYRRSPITGEPLYASEEALWSPIHADEAPLIDRLQQLLQENLPGKAQLVCPLALGGHVDHRLTRAAAERLGNPLVYYADYPYALETEHPTAPKGYAPTCFRISSEGLRAWLEAVAAYQSQISTFWKSSAEMREALQAYCNDRGGVKLWVRDRTSVLW